jgi:hypothetical protein
MAHPSLPARGTGSPGKSSTPPRSSLHPRNGAQSARPVPPPPACDRRNDGVPSEAGHPAIGHLRGGPPPDVVGRLRVAGRRVPARHAVCGRQPPPRPLLLPRRAGHHGDLVRRAWGWGPNATFLQRAPPHRGGGVPVRRRAE